MRKAIERTSNHDIPWRMNKLMIAAAFAVAALSGAQVQADAYIRVPSGTVMPKHECQTSPCVDCTFLDYKTCHDQAEKLGLIDKNVGVGPGQRPPLRTDRVEEPLEAECSRQWNTTTMTVYPAKGGQIICPVPGAVAVDAPQKPKRIVEAWLPDQSPGGNAAVGIFFTQFCPGYLTPAAREHIHTVSQFRAREAWDPYNEIQAKIAEAARANRTSAKKELYEWCIAAEPRINAIQDKLGQALR
jgi:hypothetical protein